MTLPYVREVKYLSPSSLFILESNPMEFYLQRCGPQELAPKRQPQTLPMAIGSAFDANVKVALAEVVGCICPDLETLIGRQVESQHLEQAALEGLRLLRAYKRVGAFDRLVAEGLKEVELEPATQELPGTERLLMGRQVAGVPVKGRPDAMIIKIDGSRVILDWKVTGSGNDASNPSPMPGYSRLFDSENPLCRLKPAHDRSGDYLETINPGWATQLATYHWLMRPGTARHESFQDADVAVDQVLVGLNGRVRVGQLRLKVSGEWQVKVRDRYVAAWERIKSHQVVDDMDGLLTPELVRVLR